MPTRTLTTRRLLVAGFLGSLLLAATPGVAHAHADVVSSTPRQGAVLSTAPSIISIRFGENIAFQSIPPAVLTGEVFTDTRPEIHGRTMTLRLLRPLPRGITVVSWHILSEDGDPVSGVLAFVVGRPGQRGPSITIATTPKVPTRLSGSRPGPLTVTFAKAVSSGEIEWRHPQMPAPITWSIAPGSRTATGVLPFAGGWHMRATLVSPQFAVVIVNGDVDLHE